MTEQTTDLTATQSHRLLSLLPPFMTPTPRPDSLSPDTGLVPIPPILRRIEQVVREVLVLGRDDDSSIAMRQFGRLLDAALPMILREMATAADETTIRGYIQLFVDRLAATLTDDEHPRPLNDIAPQSGTGSAGGHNGEREIEPGAAAADGLRPPVPGQPNPDPGLETQVSG